MRSSTVQTLLLLVFSAVASGGQTHRVPDDHPTIQAAIDAAASGDTVIVEPGVYHERIELKSGITLRSAGDDSAGAIGLRRAETTIIDGGGEAGKSAGVTLAEGAVLDGFTITNVGNYDDEKWTHHHATQGNEQSHEHIGHFGVPGVGIVGDNCTVINNIVHHNGDTGIAIRGAEGRHCAPLVAHNVCHRNMGGGIGSMGGSEAVIDSNRCFENFYAGIGHDNANPIVTRNECYGNVRAGIGVSEGACPVVRGNRCHHNRRAGIGIRTGEATSPVIEDNDCFENDMAGIGCEEHATPIIRRNRCHHNALAGIGAQSGAQPVIVANECLENGEAGIGCREESRPVIVDNECRQNQTTGIGIRGGANAVVCRNRCIENKLVAIGLPDGATAVICDNELVRTGGMPPLVAVREAAEAVFARNRLRGGGVAGILVQGSVDIIDCEFEGISPKQGNAVWVWDSSVVGVRGNTFTGYATAVNARGSRVTAADNQIHGFKGTAIVVQNVAAAPHVVDNVAYSDDPQARVTNLDEPGDAATGNVVLPTADSAPLDR